MKEKRLRREALKYHMEPRPGKIEVIPTKKHSTQRDLSLAYSPGVAIPCMEIHENPEDVYKYTNKGNLVAVISNGTAVLGLGNIGAEAGKPVMEGKALLFKIFADIDVFDIEIDTENIDEFIETVKNIAPTFGGINLEDIKAPEAFEIEERLKEELDIPVMHDDQHGTAIISAAALLNATELAGKKLEDLKIVVNGAGAAAVSCTKLYQALGVKRENIIMLDSKGVIKADRPNLSPQKKLFATTRDVNTLEEAMKDADVFVGLSIGNILNADHLKSMAKNPIVFALANPTPEIDYKEAIAARKDVIMATGRSDYPNQVNNVLGFPYIFRGALDVRATKINEEMKLAAVKALAELAKESVPEQVNAVYHEKHLSFGKDYIIPKPFDPRLIYKVPPAVAKAAMESGVARKPIEDFDKYEEELMDRLDAESKQIRYITNQAKKNPKVVVYPEGDLPEVLKAAYIAYEEGIAQPILLGNKEAIEEVKKELEYTDNLPIIDTNSPEVSDKIEHFAQLFWEKHQRKGITMLEARKLMRNRNYFGAMMVETGEADAVISGYSRSFRTIFKPMIEVIGKAPMVEKVFATTLLITKKGPLFFTDSSIVVNPDVNDIVRMTAMMGNVVKMFRIKPNIALLSFSNFGSSKHPEAQKMKKAALILRNKYPELNVDGEMQADFALNKTLLKEKFPFSKLVNKKINTLIFPNLDAANISYRLIKEMTKAPMVGPIMMGMNKPVHILQIGSTSDEIVNMTVVAVIDAQMREKQHKEEKRKQRAEEKAGK
jgi:malate dehydrogenase (oxaloacetate-decarboxylating)(NADP+)